MVNDILLLCNMSAVLERRSEALDFACGVLHQNPADIWVEDVLAAIFIGLLDAVAWLLVRILPERKQPADPSLPRYLDETTLDTPSLAIANAARETLAAKAV